MVGNGSSPTSGGGTTTASVSGTSLASAENGGSPSHRRMKLNSNDKEAVIPEKEVPVAPIATIEDAAVEEHDDVLDGGEVAKESAASPPSSSRLVEGPQACV